MVVASLLVQSHLLEDVPDVGLTLSEPHGEELRSLHGDEVSLALVGDGLRHKGLTAAGRAVEENSLGRGHSKLLELLGVLDGVLNELLEVPLDLLESANVVPADVGNLDDGLSERGGVGGAEGVLKVVLANGHSVQNLSINGLFLDINEVHLLPDALHGSLSTEGGNVSSHESVGLGGDGLGVDVLVELHVTGVDAEDFKAAVLVGDSNVDLPVEAAETAEGRVHGVGAVGGADDNDGGTSLHAVHKGKHLRDDPAMSEAGRGAKRRVKGC